MPTLSKYNSCITPVILESKSEMRKRFIITGGSISIYISNFGRSQLYVSLGFNYVFFVVECQ